MIKLELLVNKDKVVDVKELLTRIGIKKISLIEVKEYDEDNVHVEGYRGSTYVVEFSQKIKFEVILKSEEFIKVAIDTISQANIDAEILVYEIYKSRHIHHQKKKKSAFSIKDEYEEMMTSSFGIRSH